jgi:MFS family permease
MARIAFPRAVRSFVVIRRGPLAGRYPAVAAMVMFALIPYLALSAALEPLTPIIAKQLHASLQTMSLGSGLANAAYAVGTVLAVQFAQHLPQRRMMFVYAVLLVIGSVLTAAAQNADMFIVGHVIQGLCTSLLLISAVPPLALGYPPVKLRDTAVIMNMCIFGAVALGPFIGGLQAEANGWRPLFWIVAAISAGALVLTVLTFDDAPPANPDSPRDLPAIALAAVGCVAAFFGASELTSHRFLDPLTIVPMLGGLATIVVLVIYQYHAKRPLLMVRTMLTSSIPVAGISVALFAAAASVSATALTVGVLEGHYSPLRIGVLFLPEVGGAVVTAFVLGRVIRRRSIHYLPLFGMIALAAGIAVFRIEVPSSQLLTLIGSGLTGIGLGATVAPALFVAGFSLPSNNLQRVFAIVELFRAVAAFMIAPIFVYFASTISGNLDEGTAIVLWVGLGLAIAGAVIGVAIYALSGARPQTPDLDRFLSGAAPAWDSPPLLARVHSSSSVATLGTETGD